ncbi:hypothetical protein EMPS_04485 [Entomortierella parvispora]|uniref:Ubiquitin-like domain-containing protein n=1 Tax=Entomortierella parvispora TaxID=205924 RepID=A0A9P3LVI3_9FUNG|nr:hypothetical protein EMPS_04485 [Entomortierella parvispora]
MSYDRVNDSSGSDDDSTHSPSLSPSQPLEQARTSVQRVTSSAVATLANITGQSAGHGYSRIGEEEDSPEKQANHSGSEQIPKDEVAEDNDLEINVRFGEGQDLSLRVPRTHTIAQMKEKIKEARPSIGEKYLRLIHSGKILLDNKTLIDSLPKSLFAQVEIPQTHHSRISSSVEAVEAAAHNILAGISSRASGEKSAPPTIRTHTSLGAILPTHTSSAENSTIAASTTGGNTTHGSASVDHVVINMPDDFNTSNPTSGRVSTVKIPVQTGPIYFLCSLSDIAPSQPPSAVKKGKAVAAPTSSTGDNNNRRTSGSRSLRRPSSTIPTSTTGSGTAASSSLTLPRRGAGQGNRGTDMGGSDAIAEVEDGEDEAEAADGHEELSPVMAPQATGFDRLREAGFSEDEIRSIRRQFHASRGTAAASVGENGIAADDEDATARARRIEEEWIDQHGAETLPEGLEGSYGEMVWGLMLGFFMGLVALFWFKEATFSRRQQMGIIAGLTINLGFGVLHLYY